MCYLGGSFVELTGIGAYCVEPSGLEPASF